MKISKQKLLSFIPYFLVTSTLLYCWIVILFSEVFAIWKHYTGLALFLLLLFSAWKNSKKATIGLGIYLLLGTFNCLAITPTITTRWIFIGEFSTPPVQLLSLGFFVVYLIFNFDHLIEMQLDYQEARSKKKNRS